jgi:hypothetical protein
LVVAHCTAPIHQNRRTEIPKRSAGPLTGTCSSTSSRKGSCV